MKTYAIVPAAGRGIRMGLQKPKQFLELAGKPLLAHTLSALSRADCLRGIYLVVPKDFIDEAKDLSRYYTSHYTAGLNLPVEVVEGGAERQDSVSNGLKRLPRTCEWVVIHDGVRPFVTPKLITDTWKAAHGKGAAIAAVQSTDTVKKVADGQVIETLPREFIWMVQTPQVFRRELLEEAYKEAMRQGWSTTDDAALIERLGYPIAVVPGERTNIKVTNPEDLPWAEFLLNRKTDSWASEGREDAGSGA